MTWTRPLFRMALWLLPARLRRKHGSAMEDLLVAQVVRARNAGRLRAVAAVVLGVVDVVRRAAYERMRHGGGVAVTRDGPRGRTTALEWMMEMLRQDMTQAVRSLWKTPRFTVVAMLTLALGIGANTAIFSVIDSVMLRPLPFPEPDRFVHLAWNYSWGPNAASPAKFEYYREHTRSYQGMATYRGFLGLLDEGDQMAGVRGLRVTDDFLKVVGVGLVQGRDFTPEEQVPDGPDVAIISTRLWQQRFGGASSAVGSTLRVNEKPYTVVGILPPGFRLPEQNEDVQVMVPMGLRADPRDEGANYPIIARLRADVTREEAQAELDGLTASFREALPGQVEGPDEGMEIIPFQSLYFGSLTTTLWIVMGAVALVLLIACANVANLLLARATRRRREIAVRAALGATRARIARLVLTESVILALVAGGLGLLLARWGVSALIGLAPVPIPRADEIGVDWRVLVFTFGAALGTGVIFGGAAAWPAVRARLTETLKEAGRANSGRGRARQGLLTAQAALSMMLLVGAGLLVATLVSMRQVNTGFQPEGLTAVRFPFQPPQYRSTEARWALEQRIMGELASRGVRQAAAASSLPLERGLNLPLTIGGRPDDFEGAVEWRAVSPGYFSTLGIDLLAGRPIEARDEMGSPPVALVNEAFVRRYFPDQNPIGQHVEIGRYKGQYIATGLDVPAAEIVGVVPDIRDVSLKANIRRTVYVAQAQAPARLAGMPVFLVRGPQGGGGVEGLIREALRSTDAALPDAEVVPMGSVVTQSMASERFSAFLLTSFAGLALILTAFGIYGVLAYTVRQRRREIGIRIALGAGGSAVTGMVVRQGLVPVAVGLALGTAGAVALSKVTSRFIWGVSATDPVTIAVVAGVLISVALLASLAPAREALATDPVRSLSEE